MSASVVWQHFWPKFRLRIAGAPRLIACKEDRVGGSAGAQPPGLFKVPKVL